MEKKIIVIPKYKDKYYQIIINVDRIRIIKNVDVRSLEDKYSLRQGNYFKTQKEATIALRKIKQILSGK